MTESMFIGRDAELAFLDTALAHGQSVVEVVGPWGSGKTALVDRWVSTVKAPRVLVWREPAPAEQDFLVWALRSLGAEDIPAGPSERGQLLIQLMRVERVVLVLDGLDRYQSKGDDGHWVGQLTDAGISSFLVNFAYLAPADGMCVVTTRTPVANLNPLGDRRLILSRTPRPDGVEMLRSLGARGPDAELGAAVDEMHGHALAITMLGHALAKVGGDVRRRGEVKLLEYDPGARAREIMESFEIDLDPTALAIMRMLGLFDRPASGAEIHALRWPAIPGLTDALDDLPETAWQKAVTKLRKAGLLAPEDPIDHRVRDAHPLTREYFGERLHDAQPEAWRAGHERLYRHLVAAAPERLDTMLAMRPLFWAVRHGCAAGLHQEVLDQVLRARIDRSDKYFATAKLGALGHLFDAPFSRPAAALSSLDHAYVLDEAGFCLRAMGCASNAATPMAACLDAHIAAEDWSNAARAANNMAELHQGLGDLALAERLAIQAVVMADQSGQVFDRMATRAMLADVLAQRGWAASAARLFAQAEAMWAEFNPTHPMLYSLWGYRTCALLLDRGQALAVGRLAISIPPDERDSWSCLPGMALDLPADAPTWAAARFAQVRERAAYALAIVERYRRWMLPIAMDHLTMGRAWLLEAAYVSPAKPEPWQRARAELDQAVSCLRDAGREDHLPLGLLARAAWHRLRLSHLDSPADPADPAAAERDLAEVEYLAARGPWRLHQADLALERCHLALALSDPATAHAHHVQARALIAQTCYHRRDAELADLATRLNEEPNP